MKFIPVYVKLDIYVFYCYPIFKGDKQLYVKYKYFKMPYASINFGQNNV
jgi:hypothetical protein